MCVFPDIYRQPISSLQSHVLIENVGATPGISSELRCVVDDIWPGGSLTAKASRQNQLYDICCRYMYIIYTYACVYIYIYMNVSMCVYLYIYICVCMCVYVCVCMHVCMYVCMHVCNVM